MTPSQAPVVYKVFKGNVDFYNDPRYREANLLHWRAIQLLKECGMDHNSAVHWMQSWGWIDENADPID